MKGYLVHPRFFLKTDHTVTAVRSLLPTKSTSPHLVLNLFAKVAATLTSKEVVNTAQPDVPPVNWAKALVSSCVFSSSTHLPEFMPLSGCPCRTKTPALRTAWLARSPITNPRRQLSSARTSPPPSLSPRHPILPLVLNQACDLVTSQGWTISISSSRHAAPQRTGAEQPVVEVGGAPCQAGGELDFQTQSTTHHP